MLGKISVLQRCRSHSKNNVPLKLLAQINILPTMKHQYKEHLEAMTAFFTARTTQSLDFRMRQLVKLKTAILHYENEINEALFQDLRKSKEEVWASEIGLVLGEIKFAIKNLSRWMKPHQKMTNLLNFPSASQVIAEPKGVVLIIAPWNYPFQLLMSPLVGAIAAGNCVVLKPSEHASATEKVMQQIIKTAFREDYVWYVTGDGATVIPSLMGGFKFDHVFYTGGTKVGTEIYKMAAEKLTPTTLELGGKSPCIITANANIAVAAKRIAFSKFSNAGQTCVAPDYILVHESVKEDFIQALKKTTEQFYPKQERQAYGRIINDKQFDRIVKYLDEGEVIYGGDTDKETLYISPTIIDGVNTDMAIMQEEIFGPILPIITYTSAHDVMNVIRKNPDPLAFYIFTNNKREAIAWLAKVPSGGACVNNCSLHVANHHLPFGGRGNSGIGNYHGTFSFHTFSHQKSVLKSPTWFDPNAKYPPFEGKLGLLKKLMS
mgnify:CR=1 FL=1